ncbi:MAG: DUF2637 domain-containing protein [Trebonia sp.]
MNVQFPAPRRNWPSLLLNLAVLIVVLAMAAGTFVLSYSGVHAIVLQAGVSPRLARIYPGLFDAVFVIACVAAVVLRDARWWARWYAWLVIILMVVVVGAADVVYAINATLRHRTIEGVVAAAPWVLLLLAFCLMLTMLRQSRVQQAPATALAEPAEPAEPVYLASGQAELPEAAPEPETPALPIGVWLPQHELEPDGVSAPEGAGVPQDEDVPQDETAQPEEPAAAAGVHAPEPGITEAPVAQEADADARDAVADVDAAGETGPVEPVEEEPVMAVAADEAPPWEPEPAPEPEPAADPEPAAEPVAAGNGGGAAPYATYREEAAATTPYNYWDSGAGSGFHEPDRVPTLPGEVIDEDAPPFATAPFAAVPRLNRVRSTPTPPEGDDEEE